LAITYPTGGYGTGAYASNAIPITINSTTNLVNGATIIIVWLFAFGSSQPTISKPSSGTWTQIGSSINIGAYCQAACFWHVWLTGETSYTFITSSATYGEGCLLAFNGVNVTTPVDVSNNMSAASGTSLSVPTISTAFANEVLIGFCGSYYTTARTYSTQKWATAGSVTATPDTGGTRTSIAASYLIWTGSGVAGAFTATISGSNSGWIGFVVALRANSQTMSATDTGHGTDTNLAGKTLKQTDTGAGVDAAYRGKLAVLTDSGSGLDAVLRGKLIDLPDSASGVDAVLTNKTLKISETGAGADGSLADKTLDLPDSAAGVDLLLLGKSLLFSDSGAGVDVIVEGEAFVITDVGSGVDQVLIGKTLMLSESGAGIDGLVVGKTLLIIDSASGEDTVLVGKVIDLEDTGTGVDGVFTGKVFTLADSAIGTDSQALGKILELADSGLGVDEALRGKILSIIDTGGGVDQVLAGKFLVIADYGIGIDSLIVTEGAHYNYILSDSGRGFDSLIVQDITYYPPLQLGSYPWALQQAVIAQKTLSKLQQGSVAFGNSLHLSSIPAGFAAKLKNYISGLPR